MIILIQLSQLARLVTGFEGFETPPESVVGCYTSDTPITDRSSSPEHWVPVEFCDVMSCRSLNCDLKLGERERVVMSQTKAVVENLFPFPDTRTKPAKRLWNTTDSPNKASRALQSRLRLSWDKAKHDDLIRTCTWFIPVRE